MIEQLNLTSLDTPIGVAFPESGLEFYNLSEKEFLQKAPQVSRRDLLMVMVTKGGLIWRQGDSMMMRKTRLRWRNKEIVTGSQNAE